MEVVNKYGADALRLYLINSPVVSCPGGAGCMRLAHACRRRRRCSCRGGLVQPRAPPQPPALPLPSLVFMCVAGARRDAEVQGGRRVCCGEGRVPALVQRVPVRSRGAVGRAAAVVVGSGTHPVLLETRPCGSVVPPPLQQPPVCARLCCVDALRPAPALSPCIRMVIRVQASASSPARLPQPTPICTYSVIPSFVSFCAAS